VRLKTGLQRLTDAAAEYRSAIQNPVAHRLGIEKIAVRAD
jgi:hypothetical protein